MPTLTQRGDALFEIVGAKGKATVEQNKFGAWRCYFERPATKAEAKAMGWPEGWVHDAHVYADAEGLAAGAVLDFENQAAAISRATTLAGE